MSINYLPRLTNGNLGLYTNSSTPNGIFTTLSQQSTLLNPVLGMRFDPVNPKLTVGALDPADYDGEINWVQMETPGPTWTYANAFKVDGVKGYNGSFLSLGSQLRAGIDSRASIPVLRCIIPPYHTHSTLQVTQTISIPNINRYFLDPNMLGPISTSTLTTNDTPVPELLCNPQSGSIPYIPLTITINGVDYMVDSRDNLIYNSSDDSTPTQARCDVPLVNTTSLNPPEIALGIPFLRSVYLYVLPTFSFHLHLTHSHPPSFPFSAYRFPTDSCPGFYGFAFPKGLNRTQAQISQTPTTTPTLSSQCLNLIKPSSTPTPVPVTVPPRGSGTYAVLGGAQQVPLVGANELDSMVWKNLGVGQST